MAKLSPKQIVILGGIGLLVLLVLILIFTNLRSSQTPPKVTLRVWGTIENDAMNRFLEGYKNIRGNVTVEYRGMPEAGYEEAVVSALAAGNGPDVFMIPAKSLSRNKSKLYPAPPAQFGLARLRDEFPTVVEQDFADGGNVYALPLYLDTLALFYNRGLLDQASLVRPPRTWDELQKYVAYLRKLGPGGQILQAAAGIGGSAKSVPHAPDILMNLMLQNGLFAGGGADYYGIASEAGLRAMNSYIQFANSAASEYTWNDAQPNAYEGFGAGKVAMVFGYRRDALELKRKYPFLDMGVAPMPAAAGANAVAWADYWGFAVSRQSRAPEWAWDFILNFTTNPQNAIMYTGVSGLPPALRSAIGNYLNDAELGVFARQALIARSWRQPNEIRVGEFLNEAISGILGGRFNSYQALQQAQNRISQLPTN